MTAPEDPFRSPNPGAQPPGRDPAGRPVDPYGSQTGDQQHPDQQSYGQPQYGEQHPDQQSYGQPPYGEQQPYGQQPGQPGQPQYGQPYGTQPYGGPGGQPRNGLGIAALVVGILALPLILLFGVGALFGLVAIVLGVLGLRRARRGEATNGGMAIAGIVLGVISILLVALIVAFFASVFDFQQFSNLTECLEEAAGDPAAEQQCQTDFEDEVAG